MPINEHGLSEEARRWCSPGYVAFTQKPEVLETQPEGNENAKWSEMKIPCFSSSQSTERIKAN